MKILGISAFYHDSAAAILKDGEILAACQEERFTRKKHDFSFPLNSIKFCLDYTGYSIDELDAVVFYEKPFLKFERLLTTYYVFAPKGLSSFLMAIPVWIKEKLFIKDLILKELSKIENFDKKRLKLLFSQHHLSHASSAFFPSPFEESAILTIDGVGEWSTASISYGKGKNIKILKELNFPHSVGLLYSAFTYYLGFKVNSGEYKLMGLAPYGDPTSERVEEYKKLIHENIVDVKKDGSIWLNQDYFDYSTGLKMVKDSKWEKLFGFPPRKPESEIEQHHCDLALAIQQITEDVVFRMAETARNLTGSKNLCMAGGVALNCVANGKLLKKGLFEDIWIQPASGDAGGAIGSAYAVYHMYFMKERLIHNMDAMKGSYLGPEYSELDIVKTLRKYKAPYKYFEDLDELSEHVANLLAEGNVVGWFQGRMEWGPRALGNRSILGDARNPEMQKRLNLKIKFRESFRPFAPSIIYEDIREYFDLDKPSPYMLLIADVVMERRKPLPDMFHKLPIRDKLYFIRSDIPAITHLDFSARLQTVHEETNPKFYKLLKKFREKTGYSVIVNTSFNVRGEPIVCSPEDAYKCFMRTDMDYLVMENFLLEKKNQPEWEEKRDWREEYGLD
ncbi:MAG: carbamoyltransferase family protein [Candidatus Aminicenantia bacterium]